MLFLIIEEHKTFCSFPKEYTALKGIKNLIVHNNKDSTLASCTSVLKKKEAKTIQSTRIYISNKRTIFEPNKTFFEPIGKINKRKISFICLRHHSTQIFLLP